jgi:hypothetical protein
VDFELERGANGAMTGYAFPDMLVQLVRLSQSGARDAAHDLFDAHLPLMRYEQQPGVGLAVRKYILKKRGAIAFRCAAQAGHGAVRQGPRGGGIPAGAPPARSDDRWLTGDSRSGGGPNERPGTHQATV